MRFSIIVCFETDLPQVRAEIEHAGAPSYTFLTKIFGRGKGGQHLDSEVGPGFNAAVLVACEADVALVMQQRLRALQQRLRTKHNSVGLHGFSWEAEQWL